MLAHLRGERGQRIGLHAVLAGKAADIEQPRFDQLEPRRIERQRVGRPSDLVLRLASFDQRPVQRRQRLGEHGMVGGPALDPPPGLAKQRERAFGTAEQLVEPGQRFARLESRLHRRALLGQAGLLALLGREPLDFLERMFEPFAVALGGGGLGPRLRQFAFDPRHFRPRPRNRARIELAERIEQVAVALGVEQAAVVVLAVDLDRQRAEVAEQARGRRAAGDEGAAAAIALERPANDQRLAWRGFDPLLPKQFMDRMTARQFDLGRNRRTVLARADQPDVGPRTQRQAECVEQDRLAGAGLAGEHAEARLELELEPFDQDDVVDGKLPQHATISRRCAVT